VTRARFEELTEGRVYFTLRYFHRGRYCITDPVRVTVIRNAYVLLEPEDDCGENYSIGLASIGAVKYQGGNDWVR
jgi:hypothetical protein